MKLVLDSSARRGAAAPAMALVIAFALAGCTGSTATAVPVVTPTPAVTSTATAAPTPTATPEVTATPEATSTPGGSTTPAASPTIAASPTNTAAVSPSPAASPTSAAAGCTGTADNQAFFVDAASKLSFDVYCAVLPAGWWLQSGSYVLSSGGYLNIEYKNSSGAAFTLREGGWCPPSMACIAHGPDIGPASFGALAGTLHLNNTTYTLEVGTYAKPQYLMVGSGMTQAKFVALAAALRKVPKP